MRSAIQLAFCGAICCGVAQAAPPNKPKGRTLKSLQSKSVPQVLAAVKKLRSQLSSRRLAPHLVPLLLHKDLRVRRASGDVVGEQGWDGVAAAQIAKLSRDPAKARLIPGLVKQANVDDRLLRATAKLIADANRGTQLGTAIASALMRERPAIAVATKPSARRKSLLRMWRESVMLAWFSWDGSVKAGTRRRLVRHINGQRPNFTTDPPFRRRRSKAQMRASLLSQLNSSDPVIVKNALDDIRSDLEFGDFHENQILKHLETNRRDVQWAAIGALRIVDAPWSRIESGIRRAIRSKREDVRSRVVQSLKGTRAARTAAAQKLLFDLAIGDSSVDVRRNSAAALGSVGPAAKKHYPALLKAIEQEKNATVQVAQVQACRRIVEGKPKTQRALANLERRLRHKELVQLARSLLKKQREVSRRTRKLQIQSVFGERKD